MSFVLGRGTSYNRKYRFGRKVSNRKEKEYFESNPFLDLDSKDLLYVQEWALVVGERWSLPYRVCFQLDLMRVGWAEWAPGGRTILLSDQLGIFAFLELSPLA